MVWFMSQFSTTPIPRKNMVALAYAKLLSYTDKILATFFLEILPEIIRLIFLSACVLWKHYKVLSSNYNFMSMINKKTTKFRCRRQERPELRECFICLMEFAEGEEGRKLIDCKHDFHRHCLEKWLKKYHATCPLCRTSVVPEVIVKEYHMMQIEEENDVIGKELALILLNGLQGRICNGAFY